MKLKYILFIFIIHNTSSLLKRRHLDEDLVCHVTSAEPREAELQLEFCYKYNEKTCCDSVTDSKISDYINVFIPDTCVELNQAFADYVCLGCNPNQPKYVDEDAKVVRICNSYAKKIWGENLSSSATEEGLFNCLFKYDSYSIKMDYEWGVNWVTQFEADSEIPDKETIENDGYFNPKKIFKDFDHFIKYFKPRYFENYTIDFSATEKCLGSDPELDGSSFLNYSFKILLFGYFLLLLF